ncbi:4'-phosphopantetheinyl transferase superfamily protein [bacterium]|nr:4'-phosphopantetheinyl transferase superfamily protein [bacterium]
MSYLEIKPNQVHVWSLPFSHKDRKKVEKAFHEILQHYLPKTSLVFVKNKWGKPSLKGLPLHFNISHSGNLALLAISLNQPLGVDVEKMRKVSVGKIAERYFSKKECEFIQNLPKANQTNSFFTLWTQKEAIVKAKGVGLAGGLSKNPQKVAGYQVEALEVKEGYQASIAVKGKLGSIVYWDPGN